MTTSRNGKRAASIHPQNALSINPALLWLASLTPAGRRGCKAYSDDVPVSSVRGEARHLPLAYVGLHERDAGTLGAAG